MIVETDVWSLPFCPITKAIILVYILAVLFFYFTHKVDTIKAIWLSYFPHSVASGWTPFYLILFDNLKPLPSQIWRVDEPRGESFTQKPHLPAKA